MARTVTHLLDTSVFCQPIKDCPLAVAIQRWSSLGDAAVATSAICLAEILQGLEARRSEQYWRRYRDLLAGRYAVLAFDGSVAVVFGKLAAAVRAAGKPRPTVDLMIAATARAQGLVVATLNARDFAGLPGVTVEDWSPPAATPS